MSEHLRSEAERRRQPAARAPDGDAWLSRLTELAAGWAPEPLDDAGRTRFDARLFERIERERSGPVRLGRFAVPLAAAALLGLGLWGLGVPGPGGGSPAPSGAESTDWQVAAWEWDLLLGSGVPDEEEEPEALPEEYAAIASVFLEP